MSSVAANTRLVICPRRKWASTCISHTQGFLNQNGGSRMFWTDVVRSIGLAGIIHGKGRMVGSSSMTGHQCRSWRQTTSSDTDRICSLCLALLAAHPSTQRLYCRVPSMMRAPLQLINTSPARQCIVRLCVVYRLQDFTRPFGNTTAVVISVVVVHRSLSRNGCRWGARRGKPLAHTSTKVLQI